MKNNKQKFEGFTLVEVMVVVIIIAVLAAVAIPLMTGNVKRAIATEGIAGLGTIRSNMRAMLAETGDYKKNPQGNDINKNGLVTEEISGFSTGDLTGRYFKDTDYSFQTLNQSNFLIRVVGSGGTEPPGAERALNFKIDMSSQGTIRLWGEAGNDDEIDSTD